MKDLLDHAGIHGVELFYIFAFSNRIYLRLPFSICFFIMLSVTS